MSRELSLAYLTVLGASPPDMVAMAAQCGYTDVGLRLIAVTPNEIHHDLVSDRALRRDTRMLLGNTGVRVLDVELVKLYPDTRIRTFEPYLEAAADLGARHVIVGGYDPDASRLTENFARFCDLAARYNLSANLEFVTWTDVPDLMTAASIVRDAGQPNGGILVDFLHFWRSRCKLEDLDALPKQWFRFAQACDAPALAPTTADGLIATARGGRNYLGEGGLNVGGIIGHLPAGIPLSLEIPTTESARGVPALERARRAFDTTTAFLGENIAHD